MSEEEIMQGINKTIAFMKEELKAEHSCFTIQELWALNGLLDLYNKEKMNSSNLSEQLNKEKEKNEELENTDLTTVYINGFYGGEKKWKDKIKNMLDDYIEKSQYPLVNAQSRKEYTFGIRALQKLLEERN